MKEALAFLAIALANAFGQSGAKLIEAPRVWTDRDLLDWATPVAGLNVRPGHFSEKEYYSAPVGEFVRTYSVYFPGREPAGYWDMLRNAKPELLITPGARTMADWVKEGNRVFHELDISSGRIYDPDLVETLRSAHQIRRLGGQPREDGTLSSRWVPTSKRLANRTRDGVSSIAFRTSCCLRWHNTFTRCTRLRTRTSVIPAFRLDRKCSIAKGAGCHTPPLYTNNKLTLAAGFVLPKDHPLREDVMPVSIGTNPNLALKTRKGTGLYKVPSLRGVWYRSALSHYGSVDNAGGMVRSGAPSRRLRAFGVQGLQGDASRCTRPRIRAQAESRRQSGADCVPEYPIVMEPARARAQLARILAGAAFADAERASNHLRFVVERPTTRLLGLPNPGQCLLRPIKAALRVEDMLAHRFCVTFCDCLFPSKPLAKM